MRIEVRQSGGYAGRQEVASVDTSRYDSGRARRIEQLVQQASAAVSAEEPVGADLMRYEITIQNEGKTRSLSFVDDGTPSALRSLIDELRGG